MAELNTNITESKVVIFAGAGASAHLGYPVGAQFLTTLRQEFGPKGPRSGNGVGALFALADARGDENFEYVYERARNLTELVDLKQPELMHRLSDLGNEPKTRSVWDWVHASWPEFQESALGLWGELQGALVDKFTKNTSGVRSCWPHFLAEVAPSARGILPVFTTNYDLALEDHLYPPRRAGLDPCFGLGELDLRGMRSVDPELYDEFTPTQGTHGLAVLRLHGCAAWRGTEGGPSGTPEFPGSVVFDRSGNAELQPEQALVVWPSPRKLPFGEPYWHSHQYLLDCLVNCRVAVFIGYGFADTALMGMVSYVARRNSELRILICDTDDQKQPVRDRAVAAGLPDDKVENLVVVGKFEEVWEELVKRVRKCLGLPPDAHPAETGSSGWEELTVEHWLAAKAAGRLAGNVQPSIPGPDGATVEFEDKEEPDKLKPFQFVPVPADLTGWRALSFDLRLHKTPPYRGWGGLGLGWHGSGQPFVLIAQEGDWIRVKRMTGQPNAGDKDERIGGEARADRNEWHTLEIERKPSGLRLKVLGPTGEDRTPAEEEFPIADEALEGGVVFVTTEVQHRVEYRNIRYLLDR